MQWGPPHLTGGQPPPFSSRERETPEMLLGQIVNELHHLRWDTFEIKGHLTEGHRRMDVHEDRLATLERKASEGHGKKSATQQVTELLVAFVPVGHWIAGVTLVILSLAGWFTPEQVKAMIMSYAGGGGH